jgi:hypothetical protein
MAINAADDRARRSQWHGAARLFHFAIMPLALFFFLRRGAKLATHLLIAAENLLGEPGVRLASTIADSIRATVNGTGLLPSAEAFHEYRLRHLRCTAPTAIRRADGRVGDGCARRVDFY